MLGRIMRALEAVNKTMTAMALDIRELKEAKTNTGESLPSLPVQTSNELDALNKPLVSEQLHGKLVRSVVGTKFEMNENWNEIRFLTSDNGVKY